MVALQIFLQLGCCLGKSRIILGTRIPTTPLSWVSEVAHEHPQCQLNTLGHRLLLAVTCFYLLRHKAHSRALCVPQEAPGSLFGKVPSNWNVLRQRLEASFPESVWSSSAAAAALCVHSCTQVVPVRRGGPCWGMTQLPGVSPRPWLCPRGAAQAGEQPLRCCCAVSLQGRTPTSAWTWSTRSRARAAPATTRRPWRSSWACWRPTRGSAAPWTSATCPGPCEEPAAKCIYRWGSALCETRGTERLLCGNFIKAASECNSSYHV